MSDLSISQKIFEKFFSNLKGKDNLDENIIGKVKRLYDEGKLSETSQLDSFVKWLEEYNAENKKS